LTDNTHRLKRGLVIEGGGAKGAWQYGVLRALTDYGIEFDSVSGTSIGALNGALLATGRLDLGQGLWTYLRRPRIFSLRLPNISMFDTDPLKTILNEIVTNGFKVPLYATMGVEVTSYFDPDDLKYLPISLSDTSAEYIYHPMLSSVVLPVYERVDRLTFDEAIEVLLASSAFPLGVAPCGKDILKRRIVHGNVADNLPWHPMIEQAACDELIIVGCNPIPKWDNKGCRQQWKNIDRLQRVINAGLKFFDSRYYLPDIKNNPPQEIPLRDPVHWPTRIIVIAPEKPLGNFFTGTINFSAKTAQNRIQQGYQTGHDVISTEFGRTNDLI